ncbi:MAG: hypothetical protein J5898_04905 [Lachnospiraceae bacterium]|nr:hypothetical protein [Lachnospiraceae bacterium]
MTSQKSTNKTESVRSTGGVSLLRLMREDLRHNYWMLALSILGNFLAGPMAFLFHFSRRFNLVSRTIDNTVILKSGRTVPMQEWVSQKADNCFTYLTHTYFYLQLVIVYGGALIVAFFAFRYLYSRRMVDLYHSAPVSRKRLFISIWLNGFLVWFIPFMICQTCVHIASAFVLGDSSYFGELTMVTVGVILRVILCYLIVYHACLVPVMLCGNLLNSILGGLVYGLYFFAFNYLFTELKLIYFDTFFVNKADMYNNIFTLLSPLAEPVVLSLHWNSNSTFFEWGWLHFGAMTVSVCNFFLAYFLYLKRPSEYAEKGLENKWIRGICRFGLSLLAGMVGGRVFHSISPAYRFAWTLFGVLLASAVTFCFLNIVFHSSFREILSHKLHYIGVLAACILLFSVMRFDLTGFESYVPKQSDIRGLSFFSYGLAGAYQECQMTDHGLTEVYAYDEIHKNPVFRDPEKIHRLLSEISRNDLSSDPLYMNMTAKIITSHGTYYRQYGLTREDLKLLDDFIGDPAFLREFFPVRELALGLPQKMELHPLRSISYTVDSKTLMNDLLTAMHNDMHSHLSGEYFYLMDSGSIYIGLLYPMTDITEAYYHSIPIPPWYTETIAVLKKYYPDEIWDYRDAEVQSVTFADCVPLESELKQLETLYQNLGFHMDGTPFSTDELDQLYDNSFTQEAPLYLSWEYTVTDPAMLAKLIPYLTFECSEDLFFDKKLYIGYITMTWTQGGKTSDIISNCYIDLGKIPPELLTDLEQAMFSTDSYQYFTPYYSYGDFYY